MDKNSAHRNLEEIAEALKNVKWWLEAGTCLGAIREGDFIDHDLDIDIGIAPKENPYVIIESLIQSGFHLWHIFGTPDKGFEIDFRKRGVKCDVFFFYEDTHVWHAAWDKGEMLRLEFDKSPFKNLKQMKFRGITVYVPNPPEEYLTARYGDWQTVKKDWKWNEDPLCIKR